MKKNNRAFTLINRVGQVGPALQPCGTGSDNTPVKGHLAAFTLIELLVVVLISSILAAVAVPQYQRAAEKARMTEAIANVRTIASATQVYYLANGTYPTSITQLDIAIPYTATISLNGVTRLVTKDWAYAITGGADYAIGMATRIKPNKQYNTYFIYVPRGNPNMISCGLDAANDITQIQKQLCNELATKGTL